MNSAVFACLFAAVFVVTLMPSTLGIKLMDKKSGKRKCHVVDMFKPRPNTTVECEKSCSVVWDNEQPVFSLCDFSYAPKEGCVYLDPPGICVCFCNSDLCNTFDYPHSECLVYKSK